MTKRNFLTALLGMGVTAAMGVEGEAAGKAPLSTAAITKSTLALADKCAKAGLTQEAVVLWEAHRRLVALPISVEKPYPYARDEDEPGLVTSKRAHLKPSKPNFGRTYLR